MITSYRYLIGNLFFLLFYVGRPCLSAPLDAKRRAEIPPVTQALSWPMHHSPPGVSNSPATPVLPDVSEVWRNVAQLPPQTQSPNTPTMTSKFRPAGTWTTVSAASTQLHLGPGLVIPSTSIDGFDAPPTASLAVSVINTGHPPIRKLLVVGSVFAGLIALTIIVFLIANRKVFCSRKATKHAPIEYRRSEKIRFQQPWVSAPSLALRGLNHTISRVPVIEESPRVVSDAADVTPDFPRSKFSVTSSDYSYSSRSSTNSCNIVPPTPGERPVALMSPADFFRLSSTSEHEEALKSHRHSEPASGSGPPPCTRRSNKPSLRLGEHRKSKSVSGLVYIVPPVARNSAQSSYRGNTPPSPTSSILHEV